MLKLIGGSETEIEQLINSMGPVQIVSAYAVNQKHFAWVKVPEAKKKEK